MKARNLLWLSFGIVVGGLLCLGQARAADFTGTSTEQEHVMLGVGVVLSFALGWIAGGQR